MRQTLFTIPHFLFEGPILIAWLIIGALVLLSLFYRHGASSETWSFLPIYVIVALVALFVLPRLEIMGVNPDDPSGDFVKQGLAVRGYGVFLLLGIVCGVGITMLRSHHVGLTPDHAMQLAFWMIVCGIIGARVFYVVQKSDGFFSGDASLQETILNVVDMTKGGLVVYGSLFGGLIAAIVYLKWQKLPIIKTADLMAPGMVLGLAIGRIGCLMNGCCYGGVCEAPLPVLEFPAASPPYMQQLDRGELLGIHTIVNPNFKDDGLPRLVKTVEPASIGAELGVQPGDRVAIDFGDEQRLRYQKLHDDGADGLSLVGYIHSDRQGTMRLPVSELPDRSLRTHPTQVYSAINAALLCLVLWSFWTIRKSDGEVFALLLILYPIARFLIELIRVDEMGVFGTSLTISQVVSLITIVCGFALFAFARLRGSQPATV